MRPTSSAGSAGPAEPGPLQVLPVWGLPEVRAGDDLAAMIAAQADLVDGDVVVVAQKVVSKAEGATVRAKPGEDRGTARRRLAREQAVRVVVDAPEALIVETHHGLVCANAGIDASNVPDDALLLLPADPDATARALRAALRPVADVAVIVADTFGRPWRVGLTDVAIGVAGLAPLRDERGSADRQGARMVATQAAVADELAAAADLVRRKADGVPVVVVRGFAYERSDRTGAWLLHRAGEEDLFRRGRGGVADALGVQAPGPGPVAADALERAAAAARRVGGPGVSVVVGDRVLSLTGADLDVGVAAGAAMAALVDLGYAACVVRGSAAGAGVQVVAGTEPEPADDAGR